MITFRQTWTAIFIHAKDPKEASHSLTIESLGKIKLGLRLCNCQNS